MFGIKKSPAGEPVRVVHIVAAACTAEFMRGQLGYLRSRGYQVTVIASPEPSLETLAGREGIEIVPVEIPREMRPVQDLIALVKLFFVLRKIRPHVVNASTPKAGLLGMLAAWLLRVPVRIYTLRGLRLETTDRLQRRVLFACEWLTAACAHRVICVSRSLREAYLELRCTKAEKTLVLGSGSSNGVDAEKFRSTPQLLKLAAEVRREYEIPVDSLVLGFVGRLTRDKGVADLLDVFEQIEPKFRGVHLLAVGDFETGDCVRPALRQRMLGHDRIHVTGMVDLDRVASYYRACDLLLFPSLREGFPNAVLEAQASELAVVGYAATGTLDAIDDGRTGVIVPLGDREGLVASVVEYLADEQLRLEHGRAGRVRVEKSFRPQGIWESLADCYEKALCLRGLGKLRENQQSTVSTSQVKAA